MFKKYWNTIVSFWKETPLYLQIIFLLSAVITIILALIGLQNGIIFSFDQARDAIEAYSIWHGHHLKILGPSTDIPGIFHGVLWYYFLAIVYAVVRKPEFVAGVFCVFLFLTTPFVGLLTEELFANRAVTIISMVLYMLSAIVQTSSRWLSNPIPSFLVSPILLLLLWEYIKKQDARLAFFIGICYGIIIQADFGFLLLLVTIPVYWLVFRLPFRVKEIFVLIVGLFLSLSTFFIAEVKFHGQGVKGMQQYFHSGTPHHTFLVTLSQMWERLIDFFAVTLSAFPRNCIPFIIVIVFVFCLAKLRSSYIRALLLLLVWFGAMFIFLLSGTGIATSYFLFFPFVGVLIILGSFTLVSLFRNPLLITIILIVFAGSQIISSFHYIRSNTSPLPAQQGATLNYEKQIITYTYQAARGQPFTIITITNPLYIDTTWAYLYSEYGLSWYHYVPNYGGRGQTNIIGENLLPEIPFATKARYLIIEPTDGLATIYVTKITYEEDKVSNIVETRYIGRYIIQKRILQDHKPLPPIPDELKGKPILYE